MQSYAVCLLYACFRSPEILFIFIAAMAKVKDFPRISFPFCILLHLFTYSHLLCKRHVRIGVNISIYIYNWLVVILHVSSTVCELDFLSLSHTHSSSASVRAADSIIPNKKLALCPYSIGCGHTIVLIIYFTSAKKTRYYNVHCYYVRTDWSSINAYPSSMFVQKKNAT